MVHRRGVPIAKAIVSWHYCVTRGQHGKMKAVRSGTREGSSQLFCFINNLKEAKSRKDQGVFEVKSRVKTCKFEEFGLNNWSISKSQNGGRNQVSGRVSVPGWLATPVANAPWKPLIIR